MFSFFFFTIELSISLFYSCQFFSVHFGFLGTIIYNCYIFLMNWSFYHNEIFKTSSVWGWRGSEHGSLALMWISHFSWLTLLRLLWAFGYSLEKVYFDNFWKCSCCFYGRVDFQKFSLYHSTIASLLVFKVNINCPLKNLNHSLLLNILNLLLGRYVPSSFLLLHLSYPSHLLSYSLLFSL